MVSPTCCSIILLLLTTACCPAAWAETGRDWVRATSSAPWAPRWGQTAASYGGKVWVIGGQTGSGGLGDVWSTTDGAHWTAVIPPPGNAATHRYGHTSVVHAGKMWVIGGYRGYHANDVWYSTNGTTWTLATSNAPWGRRRSHASVVYEGKMWVMGGYDGQNALNDVWNSTNGTSWTQVTAHAGWSGGYYYAPQSVVYDGKIWVIQTGAWYSSNGASWTEAISWGPWLGNDSGPSAVVCDRKIWVMGGLMRPPWFIKTNDVWSSTDGANWRQVLPYGYAPWLPRQNFPVVVFNRKMWILGGLYKSSSGDLTFLNDVWYSEIPAETTPAWKLYP